VTTILGQLPQSIQALTGFDLREAVQNAKGGRRKLRDEDEEAML
jgi:hypothetical protein